jgi:hypothetical protein
MTSNTHKGFVFGLIDRRVIGEHIFKIGMSPLLEPVKWLQVYPKDSFYIWLRYTSDPVFDEKLILDTMRLWFKNRIDIGSKYFEGNEDAVIWLLSSLMFAKETMKE